MGESSGASNKNSLKWRRSKVYTSIVIKKPESVEFLRDYWNDEPAAALDGRENTLLHLLVIRGNEEALKELIKCISHEHLKKRNIRGETALHEAARHDNVAIAEMLLDKERELIKRLGCLVPMCNCKNCYAALLAKKENLVTICNDLGETALYVAASSGKLGIFLTSSGKLGIFLTILRYNNDVMTQKNDGCTVLHAAIMGEYYRTAAKILSINPELAQIYNNDGKTALNLLASSPSSFRSNSVYTISNIGKTSFIPLQSLRVLFYKCIPSMYNIQTIDEGDLEDPDKRVITYIKDVKRFGFVHLFLRIVHLAPLTFIRLPWIQPIDDAKRKNILAVALAKQLLERETDWSRYLYSEHKDDNHSEKSAAEKWKKAQSNPLIQVIEMGIPELVEEILRYFPDAANSFDVDGKNVFHFAAEHRCGDIYEKLKDSAINKDRMLLDVDNKGNTILHHAANTKSVTKFYLGLSNLMAWDIFWFQRIRRDCSPHLLRLRNLDWNTAEDVMLKDYKDKREAVEKAVKEMNQGLMVVAALVATVSFAAVFTLPGGFDQTKGSPLLFAKTNTHKNDLDLFLSYVGLTFFASLIALGTLLSTQLSRFHMEDLYFALPLKYSIAISCLFLSSCSTITTFLQALVLEEYIPPYYVTSLIVGCVIMGLVYVDSIYDVVSYLVEVLRHSRTYRSQERSK